MIGDVVARSRVRPRGPTYADPKDVAQWAEELTASYLECRELGHLWRPFAARWVPEDRYYERVLRCTRCKTKRVQTLSRRGEVVLSHYVYPDGYQSNGMGRIVGDGRDALRLESLTRFLSKHEDG